MNTMTIAQASAKFLEHLKENGKSERTIYTYRKDLEIVEAFFHGDKDIKEMRLLQVGKFLKGDSLMKKPNGEPRAARTIEKTVRVFRMMLVHAKNNGWIEELPLPKSTPMGHSGSKQEATPEGEVAD
jgi:site-specific recombinase XerD